jgi:HSP20 family molecular chaperone IbpA
MFKKKKCNNCNEKIKDSYNFCPNCGIRLANNNKWGMLGKRDTTPANQMPNLFGKGISGSILNKMMGTMIKNLEKEFQREISGGEGPKTKIKLMINGKEINPLKEEKRKDAKTLPIEFSKENLEKWKDMKKENPKTNLKRIGDKIEYKIEVPGVKSIKDVSIVKLENSLEVKAIGNKKAYQKNITIDLPLKKFSLLKDILTLELDASL